MMVKYMVRGTFCRKHEMISRSIRSFCPWRIGQVLTEKSMIGLQSRAHYIEKTARIISSDIFHHLDHSMGQNESKFDAYQMRYVPGPRKIDLKSFKVCLNSARPSRMRESKALQFPAQISSQNLDRPSQ